MQVFVLELTEILKQMNFNAWDNQDLRKMGLGRSEPPSEPSKLTQILVWNYINNAFKNTSLSLHLSFSLDKYEEQ